MKKLFFKITKYALLVLITLEMIIRISHLTKDYPVRIIDEFGVEKWQPNQKGFSVTGNRRQNFSEFRINNSGFNSYREFEPSNDKKEIALVGDSFIEGFHQDYDNSIGKKIENVLTEYQVYEYGYAGYDLADQLNLIHQYKEDFKQIDYVFIGLDFETDLKRGEHKIIQDRMRLESPLYRNLRKIKLLTYLNSIGVIDAIKKRVINLLSFKSKVKKEVLNMREKDLTKGMNQEYLTNFKALLKTYIYDKERYILMIETNRTPEKFVSFLNSNKFQYIDLSHNLMKSEIPTTLIYDKHWNDKGRSLVANSIVKYFK